MKKLVLVAIVLGFTLSLTACPPIDEKTRDGVALAKGYLDSAKEKHPECAVPETHSAQCDVIAKGIAVKDSVIDALKVYCASESFDAGGTCQPNKDALPKLKAALRDLNTIMADVKKIGGR